jgi:hypothetical protein
MNSLVFVRALTAEERGQVEAGLRSADSFVLRRCQILLASAKGKPPPQIGEFLGCSPQNVRQVIMPSS